MPQQFLKPDMVAGASEKERRHFDYEFLYQGCVLFMCNSKPFMVGSKMILTEKKWTLAHLGNGERACQTPSERGLLQSARDWEMRGDLNKNLTFSPEITVTNLHPHLVLWFISCWRRHTKG